MIYLMTLPKNWNELEWYHYLALGDVLIILAILLYFAARSRLKMPAIIMGIVGGVGAGAALGVAIVLAMIALNVQMDRDYAGGGDGTSAAGGGPPGMGKGGMGKGGMGKGGMGKGGMGKGGMGKGGMAKGGAGPSPQTQLATLVSKLDLLTHKPLAVSLDTEQKKKMRESLDKLDSEKSLSDEQARAKLDDLRKILTEEQRKTLGDAGFRWPAQGGAAPGAATEAPPNPFSDGENKDHLKSLLAEMK